MPEENDSFESMMLEQYRDRDFWNSRAGGDLLEFRQRRERPIFDALDAGQNVRSPLDPGQSSKLAQNKGNPKYERKPAPVNYAGLYGDRMGGALQGIANVGIGAVEGLWSATRGVQSLMHSMGWYAGEEFENAAIPPMDDLQYDDRMRWIWELREIAQGEGAEESVPVQLLRGFGKVGALMAPIMQGMRAMGMTSAMSGGSAMSKFGRLTGESIISGIPADFLAWEGKDETALGMLTEYGVQNDFLDWLADKTDGSEAENRFKNALDGMVIGPVVAWGGAGAMSMARGLRNYAGSSLDFFRTLRESRLDQLERTARSAITEGGSDRDVIRAWAQILSVRQARGLSRAEWMDEATLQGGPIAEHASRLWDISKNWTHRQGVIVPRETRGFLTPGSPATQSGAITFHGSGSSFDAFDLDKMGSGHGTKAYGAGINLAESQDNANLYMGSGKDGNLYEVDLPDEVIANMLDLDLPIKDQPGILEVIGTMPEDIQKSIIKNQDATGGAVYQLVKRAFDKGDKWAMDEARRMGYDPYSTEFGAKAADQLASEYLNFMGIQGNKYLDEGSRAAGTGTRNFVVFDEGNANIISRNGEPIKPEGKK